MKAVVTGAKGFIAQNLNNALARTPGVEVALVDRQTTREQLHGATAGADVVFHLAGVNRPAHEGELMPGNLQPAEDVCRALAETQGRPVVIIASSIQAEVDNPYGRSKLAVEDCFRDWTVKSGGRALIYRLKNVFGRGCRPNYNSVVATFCHNLSKGLPISISSRDRVLNLVYIDDVVAEFMSAAQRELACSPRASGVTLAEPVAGFDVTLGELADAIGRFAASRDSLLMPSLGDRFARCLYATFTSYREDRGLDYALRSRADARGSLAEFIKSEHLGQIFVSRTRPGVTRGNHYHDTKVEKFLVVEGEAIIRFRHVAREEVIEYRVLGTEYRVVDIPPGYTHSIENVGAGELITIFWASEVFDPQRPDTVACTVIKGGGL